jgi:hypothetical protein
MVEHRELAEVLARWTSQIPTLPVTSEQGAD